MRTKKNNLRIGLLHGFRELPHILETPLGTVTDFYFPSQMVVFRLQRAMSSHQSEMSSPPGSMSRLGRSPRVLHTGRI